MAEGKESGILDLAEAIKRGNAAMVAELVRKGVDVNSPHKGTPPLVLAAVTSPEIVRALLEAGAQVDIRDDDDETPLMHAAMRGKPRIVEVLLTAGANPNAAARRSTTPLIKAVGHDSPANVEAMTILLAGGADVNLPVKSAYGSPGVAALGRAAFIGNPEVVKELLRRGADARYQSWRGGALFDAAEEGHAEIVKLLLEAGADTDFRVPEHPRVGDRGGKTAAEVARLQGHKKIAEMIEGSASPSKPPAVSVQDAWARVEAALAKMLPDIRASLCPGATSEDLRALEHSIGTALSGDARAFFEIHNGQQPGHHFIAVRDPVMKPGYFRFLTLLEAAAVWREWNQLTEQGEFAHNRSQPHPGVRKEWFHRGWIPITEDRLGNHHCLDLSPADRGKVGQIILLRHEVGARPLVADSVSEWLVDIARALISREK